MKILLINANPVVSRLLALCTRGEHIVLDEVKGVDTIEDVDYDILFVDDASYLDHVDALLKDRRIRKKVFISYDEDMVKGFDQTIKKPFLPSQIMKVIESVDMSQVIDNSENIEEESISTFPSSTEEERVEKEELPPIFPLSTAEDEKVDDILEIDDTDTEVLDSDEIEKIKALLDMDDEIALNEDEVISDDEYEARKVKIIKEQLIADGLDIIEEDAIVEELSTIVADSSEETNKRKKKETLFNKDELSRIEDAVVVALDKMKPKKIKKLLKGKKIEIKIKLEDVQ